MHRAAKSAGAADRATADFSNHLLGRDAERQCVAVSAIGAGNNVFRMGRASDAHRHRLLADAKMRAAAHFALGKEFSECVPRRDESRPSASVAPRGQRELLGGRAGSLNSTRSYGFSPPGRGRCRPRYQCIYLRRHIVRARQVLRFQFARVRNWRVGESDPVWRGLKRAKTFARQRRHDIAAPNRRRASTPRGSRACRSAQQMR